MTGMTLVTGQARPSDAAALVTQPAPPTLTGTTLARQGQQGSFTALMQIATEQKM